VNPPVLGECGNDDISSPCDPKAGRWLLPCAANADPDGRVRNHMTYGDLASFISNSSLHPEVVGKRSLRDTPRGPGLLRSFSHHPRCNRSSRTMPSGIPTGRRAGRSEV